MLRSLVGSEMCIRDRRNASATAGIRAGTKPAFKCRCALLKAEAVSAARGLNLPGFPIIQWLLSRCLERGSNPPQLQYKCSALPSELSERDGFEPSYSQTKIECLTTWRSLRTSVVEHRSGSAARARRVSASPNETTKSRGGDITCRQQSPQRPERLGLLCDLFARRFLRGDLLHPRKCQRKPAFFAIFNLLNICLQCLCIGHPVTD